MVVFVGALFLAQLSFGQITLEHKHTNTVHPVYRYYGDQLAYKYLVSDQNSGAVTIYNLDHSIYKRITFETPEKVLLITTWPLYTNVINTDELIELYYHIYYTNSENNTVKETYLVNENGTLIKKFEEVSQLDIVATENGFKLNAYPTCEIYSLPTTPNAISAEKQLSAGLPYPNPANQTIKIPYQLSGQWGTISVYSAGGQLIEQKNVDRNFNDLVLDVSDYAKGMYYYKVDKQKGSFMVK